MKNSGEGEDESLQSDYDAWENDDRSLGPELPIMTLAGPSMLQSHHSLQDIHKAIAAICCTVIKSIYIVFLFIDDYDTV